MARNASVATKVYVDESGEESRSWKEGTFLRFKFTNGETRDVRLEDYPDQIRYEAAAFNGLSQKLGDGYVRPTKPDLQAEYDADPAGYGLDRFDSMNERLKESEWVRTAEEAGPRTTLLAEAISRVQGTSVDEVSKFLAEQREARGKDGWSEFRKKLTQVKEIKVALSEIKIEREKARLEQDRAKEDTDAPTMESLGL